MPAADEGCHRPLANSMPNQRQLHDQPQPQRQPQRQRQQGIPQLSVPTICQQSSQAVGNRRWSAITMGVCNTPAIVPKTEFPILAMLAIIQANGHCQIWRLSKRSAQPLAIIPPAFNRRSMQLAIARPMPMVCAEHYCLRLAVIPSTEPYASINVAWCCVAVAMVVMPASQRFC